MRPSTIAGFDLHRPLGVGGMGQVWLGSKAAVDGIRKQVAIKLVPSVAASGRARRRFLDEARLSVLLRHSNIVQVFDVGIDGDVGFIVMEWVDGIDLAHAVAARAPSQPWPHHVVGFVIGELLQALDYAHNLHHSQRPLGLIHRDISPHNILLSAHGEVKLADFGIARSLLARATDMTMAGKWRYMAPEQLRGDPCGPPTDLFAVGVLLHELLDGEPFRGDRSDTRRRNAPALRKPAPEPLDRLRHWLLAHDPAWRPTTAREALALLRSWDGYRESSFDLAQLCAPLRPTTKGTASSDATHDTADGTATQAATDLESAEATTRTVAHPKARRIRSWRRAALWTTATALALIASGVGVWQWRQPEEFFRGGCPFDANLDGRIDFIGLIATTREWGSSVDLVILDGRDGHEIRRMPDRREIQAFICSGPSVTGILLKDGSETWTGADLDRPYSTDTVASRDGNGAVHADAKLAQPRWSPAVVTTPPMSWMGMSTGPDLGLRIGDTHITAGVHDADSLVVAATGAATWRRVFPLNMTQVALAATPQTVATVSLKRQGSRIVATLIGLDPENGNTRFEVELGERHNGSFLIATDDLLITDFGARMVALDAATGALRWSVGAP